MPCLLTMLRFSIKTTFSSAAKSLSNTAAVSSFAVVHQPRRNMSSSLSGKRIYVTRKVPDVGISLLKEAGCEIIQWDSDKVVPRSEILKNARDIDGLFCLLTDKIDKEILNNAGSRLKVVATMSVGYEHLDVAEIRSRGIKIGYTPDILTDATAELGVALLLAVSRRIVEGQKAVTSGEWSTWSPLWMCGRGLSGSTVGIVGLGRIGLGVGKRLAPFKVSQFLYSGRTEKPEAKDIGARHCEFGELIEKSDFVVVTCPLTPETKGIFTKEVFRKMKKTSIFINIARSGIVNQEDLYEALKNGTIGGAGLDVTTPEPLPPSHPLLALKNCVILPHIGSATIETRSAMSRLTAENILAALRSQPLPNELPLS